MNYELLQNIATSVWTNRSAEDYIAMRLSAMSAFNLNFEGSFATRITKDAKVQCYIAKKPMIKD